MPNPNKTRKIRQGTSKHRKEEITPTGRWRLVVPVLIGAEDVHIGVHPRLRHPPASPEATAPASAAIHGEEGSFIPGLV